MGDLWQDEGFGSAGSAAEFDGDDDWDEGEESLETGLEDGFDDPDATADDGWSEEAKED